MINAFESSVYSEELYPVTEVEHDEVMRFTAEDGDGWQSYNEWSSELAEPLQAETENFEIVDGKLRHKPEPPSRGRIGGFEL